MVEKRIVMCGIAGFVSINPDFSGNSIVRAMLEKIRYRGPDQFDVKTYGNYSIGMVRLSIIDTKEDNIPYEDPSGSHALVYNGEVYNHSSIRSALNGGYTFSSNSDAETVLYSMIDKGIDALNDFNGMFAFAYYNGAEDALYVARDKTGEKPLYYCINEEYFAFSSEMKCLLELVPPEFNADAVSYKAYEFTVGSETLFKNIYALQPGEYIKYENGKISIFNYWKIWDNIIELPRSEKQLANRLAELLEDAILLRKENCSHQYATFISGGVDSALVACIAKPDYLYTAHYDYSDFDELDYAKLVAKQLQKELKIVKPVKQDFLDSRNQIAYHLDTPCTWTSFTLWKLLEQAKSDGVKVVLSGDGADEIFAGYHRYHLLHHDQMIHQLEAMQQYEYLINRYYGSPAERYQKIVNRCDNRFDEEVNKYLDESVSFYFDKCQGDVVHCMGLNDFYSTMQVLLHMADRMSMAFSIENRSPFLDYRLVQFGFSMASEYKIRNGITKWLLKEVARKFIPEAIVDRIDKRGFSAPINRWFRWDLKGKYDRSFYRKTVFDDWQNAFGVSLNQA